jgi:hypothetical protein
MGELGTGNIPFWFLVKSAAATTPGCSSKRQRANTGPDYGTPRLRVVGQPRGLRA